MTYRIKIGATSSIIESEKMRRPAPAPPKLKSSGYEFQDQITVPTTTTMGLLTMPSAPPPGEWLESSTIFPTGLHSLMHLDRVFVDRSRGGLEAIRTWDTERRYDISNSEGHLLYTGLEESDGCARSCLGNSRAWTFHLVDEFRREVLRLQRGTRCKSCCLPCCLQKMTVHAEGTMLGSVVQRWNPCKPSFSVCNDTDELVLRIEGPCKFRCHGDLQFRIKSKDGKHRVGAIAKKCSSVAREFFDDGDSFIVAFPIDLDVKIKAVLLAACFLLDFMYYQDDTNVQADTATTTAEISST